MLQFDKGQRGIGASAGRRRLVRVSEALEQELKLTRGIDVHILVVVTVRKEQLYLLQKKQHSTSVSMR